MPKGKDFCLARGPRLIKMPSRGPIPLSVLCRLGCGKMHFADRHDDLPEPVEDSIVRAKGGSLSALRQLLETYRDYLLKIAGDELASQLVPKFAPSDLVQETCLKAARDFPAFQGGSEPELRAWLRQILVHNLLNLERGYRGTQMRDVGREAGPRMGMGGDGRADDLDVTAALPAPGPSPSSIAATCEQWQLLRQALGRLPEDSRRAIELRSLEGRSFEEIGAELGRTAGAARQLWSRAVEKLAAEMSEDDTFPGP